jgi:hypothetical protein
MGNRKKLDNVWASNTSFADTAMNRPNKADATAMRKTPATAVPLSIPFKGTKNAANATGIKALIKPNKTAPKILAKTKVPIPMGATSRRSKERLLFSNVTVTANMEVVPNNTLMAINPGRSSSMPTLPFERISCIKAQERGKRIPQLILGGLK